MNFIESLEKLFDRDLSKLYGEISAYTAEESLWIIDKKISNSAGNLCLHLCGNLQHFVGTVLGKTDYKRNREFEFAAKNIEKSKLLEEVENTKKTVLETLRKIDTPGLEAIYPLEVFGNPMTTQFFLIHLQGHLNYHLGQINYHRRLLVS